MKHLDMTLPKKFEGKFTAQSTTRTRIQGGNERV